MFSLSKHSAPFFGLTFILGFLCAVGSSPPVAHAQAHMAVTAETGCTPPVGTEADVVIAIREAPPFVVTDPVRGLSGLSIELWNAISVELVEAGQIENSVYVYCDLGAQLAALENGEVDLAISPLTITADRMAKFDFSVQYLSSGLTVLSPKTGAIDFDHARGVLRDTLTQPGIVRAIVIFLTLNLILAGLILLLLRRDGGLGEDRKENWLVLGFRYLLESITRTVGLKGVGDGFRSVSAKVLEVFMGVVGTVLSATVFGVLTSAFTSAIGGTESIPPRALVDYRIVTLADSTAQQFVEAVYRDVEGATSGGEFLCVPWQSAGPNARCLTAESAEGWGATIPVMTSGQADIVLGDWVQLTYLARQPRFADRIAVQSATYLSEPYGWGVSPDRPDLRAAIDKSLIRRMRSPYWRGMVQSHLGAGSISPE